MKPYFSDERRREIRRDAYVGIAVASVALVAVPLGLKTVFSDLANSTQGIGDALRSQSTSTPFIPISTASSAPEITQLPHMTVYTSSPTPTPSAEATDDTTTSPTTPAESTTPKPTSTKTENTKPPKPFNWKIDESNAVLKGDIYTAIATYGARSTISSDTRSAEFTIRCGANPVSVRVVPFTNGELGKIVSLSEDTIASLDPYPCENNRVPNDLLDHPEKYGRALLTALDS